MSCTAASFPRNSKRRPAEPNVETVALEEHNTERYAVNPRQATTEAERREARLVQAFEAYLTQRSLSVDRNRIRIPDELKPLFTDIFLTELSLLVEAKGTIERNAFRTAIGQLADYRRFLANPSCTILLPSRPRKDLEHLAKVENISLYWQTEQGFDGSKALQSLICPRTSRRHDVLTPLPIYRRKTQTLSNTAGSRLLGISDSESYCDGNDLEALPATPQTFALYLAELAGKRKVATVRRRVVAIARHHMLHGHAAPTADPIVARDPSRHCADARHRAAQENGAHRRAAQRRLAPPR